MNSLSLIFGKRILFKDVTYSFTPGNCYGLIGANGSGKSTFLKILSGDIEPTQGNVILGPNKRLAVLGQDQFAFDSYSTIDTVIMGHKQLYKVLKEREELYAKPQLTEEEGFKASELEMAVATMDGWEAESDAATLLCGLGIQTELHLLTMSELTSSQKVRVLLAQALFGNPDILLLDEPTNNLDIESISWLEEFLYRFENTVIVVSHDRHFLNRVCTHIADIDFNKISVFVGNYDFWYQASQLILTQKKNENRKKEEKINNLKTFIARFSSNASKARQATSRKRLLENITLDDLPISSRKLPFISFKPDRECGKNIVTFEKVSKNMNGSFVIKDFSMSITRGEKLAFIGQSTVAKTTICQLLAGELEPDSGTITWGVTIKKSYFPKDNSVYFTTDQSILEWLSQYSPIQDLPYIRGFLGRMLFSGEESLKSVSVLSGGEKVRCMLSRMMLSGANTLIFDEPTNHLDLESITALNNCLKDFPEVIFFTSHDHEFVRSIANRIIEIAPSGIIDRIMSFDEYLEDPEIQLIRDTLYHGHQRMVL